MTKAEVPLGQLQNGSLELEPVVRKPSLTLAAPRPEITQTVSNPLPYRVLKARAAPLDMQFAECWVSQEPVKTLLTISYNVLQCLSLQTLTMSLTSQLTILRFSQCTGKKSLRYGTSRRSLAMQSQCWLETNRKDMDGPEWICKTFAVNFSFIKNMWLIF